MRALPFILAALSAAAPAIVQAAAQPVAQPVAQPAVEWTRRVEATVEGGYRMGNPDAPVKLVEYASMACSHCADFAAAAGRPLRERYVATGQVSWEVRPFMIFPSDPGIFRLLQCQPSSWFFATADVLFATQSEWTGRIEADGARLGALPRAQVWKEMVRSGGIDHVFRQRGMTERQIVACLDDQAGFNRLVALQRQADAAGVQGTPTFFINGRQVPAASWAELEPLIAQAVGTGAAGAGERGR